MSWYFDNQRPLYLQLVEQLKARIISGDYPPGGRLPSVRELAAQTGVNPNTLQRAFAQLEQEGLLYTERTTGRFVTDDAARLAQLKEEAALRLADQFLAQAGLLGYSPAAAAQLLNQRSETYA